MRWIVWLVSVVSVVALSVPAESAVTCDGVVVETMLCSKTFTADGEITGQQQTPILEHPWETKSIKIVGTTIGLTTSAPLPGCYFLAGNSATPDVMNFKVGAGSETRMFPAGLWFGFPGKGDEEDRPRVDYHLHCPDAALPPAPVPQAEHQPSPFERLWRRIFGTANAGPRVAAKAMPTFRAWLVVYYLPPE